MKRKTQKTKDSRRQDRRDPRSKIEQAIAEVDAKKEKEKQAIWNRYGKIFQEWGRKTRVTPWLLLRCNLSDMGIRPLPAGVKHWLSPDITVESSDPLGNPVAEEENFIHALILNLGEVGAAPVQVDFYWGDPSIGLSAAHMHHIGTEWVEIESLHSARVRCPIPWTPSLASGAHQCLKVNCTNHLLDPIRHPFQPKLDRHAGQRNVTVQESPAGATFSLTLKLNNTFALGFVQTVRMESHHIRFQEGKKWSLKDKTVVAMNFTEDLALNRTNFTKMFHKRSETYKDARTAARIQAAKKVNPEWAIQAITPDRMPVVHTEISAKRRFIKNPQADADLGQHLIRTRSTERTRCAKPGLILEQMRMEAFEQRDFNLEVQVPHEAQKGDFLVIHLQQEIHEMAMGGYSIVVHIT
ncbi:hypothetical protein OZ410_13180 [Robiginitalea sp. M366]|uniref:hypothetical protein n=1 Tax=Robiginitalea aestuariiviva TaxID=3036903 RepID=UPI00240D8A18|nr:hypothetical protein [Robiginitalea aestuariiviva]MDG1573276.1 hypothetical protein [Robiginitalea aestuariiviva]